MYLDQDGRQVSSPDPLAGLYIQTRAGQILHVQLPPTVLAFQLGETSQIHTGGVLRATPHAVRGPRRRPSPATILDANGQRTILVTRESLAVFLEPEYDGEMDLPIGRLPEDIYDDPEHLPQSISSIQSRWRPGQNFGEFTNATFAAFYEK
jgi:isopenicillin N synthase-like dioxygenase